MFRIIAMLVSGNAVAQIVLLLCQPLLSRIYEVSQFGILAQIVSISSMVVIVGTLQMHQAMVLPKDDKESSEIFAAGCLTLAFVFIFCLLLFPLCKTSIFGPTSSVWLPLICATFILALGYGNLLRGWLTARGNFKKLSVLALVRSLLLVFFQFLFAYLEVENGLIFGALFGEVFCLAIFIAMKSAPPFAKLVATFKAPKRAWGLIYSYREFSLDGTIQELISVAAFTLPLYMFARAYNVEVGGQYAMANRLVWAPVVLIASSTTQVLFRHYSQLDINQLSSSIKFKISKRLLTILFLGITGFWVAPYLFSVILGANWFMSGNMASWVVLWGVAFLLSIPHRVCFRVLRWQRSQLKVDVVVLALTLLIFMLSSYLNPITAMIGIASVGILQNVTLCLLLSMRLKSATFTKELN